MGYYTSIIDCNFFLDKIHFNDVYQKMCELNDYHDLKRGGSFGSNQDADPNERYPKDKWFSWMDYNYPETCKDIFDILDQIGLEYTVEDGNIVNLSYYNKTGNEDYFLNCFAGFVPDGNFITFKGEEDDDYYKFVFEDGKMARYDGSINIDWFKHEVYEIGKPTQADKAAAEWVKQYRANLEKEKLENN